LSVPVAVRLFILVNARGGFGVDWFSNPWHEGGEQLVWTGDYELRKLIVSWSRTPAVGVVQDKDQCTFHFLNLTGGNPDDTWTDTDFTIVESAFDALWTTLKVKYTNEITLNEYAWRKDGPAFRPFGTELSPTVRIVSRNVAGTSGSQVTLPPQCAVTVTEVTASDYIVSGVGVPGHAPGTGRTQRRNRWGRFYLPAMDVSMTLSGRLKSAEATSVSNTVKTFYNACTAAQIVPVMYSPTTGNAWSIDSIHVDDILDVVRSRRFITPITRAPNTITPVS
jgi:hypothetical protein